jgi:hypothetical protein
VIFKTENGLNSCGFDEMLNLAVNDCYGSKKIQGCSNENIPAFKNT